MSSSAKRTPGLVTGGCDRGRDFRSGEVGDNTMVGVLTDALGAPEEEAWAEFDV